MSTRGAASTYSASKSWKDEKALVQALARQEIDEPYEVILVESARHRAEPVPASLYEALPNLQIHYFDSLKSAALKDYGVLQARGRYVAVLESDCLPEPQWLGRLFEIVHNGEWAIASGRTHYGHETTYHRVLSLLHRSWYDTGKSGSTDYVSNNGAIYERAVLEKYPYPDSTTPFLSAHLRNDRILADGHRIYFDRDVIMRHAVGGWSFLWDLQRNKGHQAMSYHGPRSVFSMRRLLTAKLHQNVRDCRRVGSDYLRWYDWPLVPVIVLAEALPYCVGMIHALNDVQHIPGSSYR